MLTIYLVKPRGFCAGVERAIAVVEKAIEKYGSPIYVRHEIVHNKFVVEALKEKGVIFVNEIDEIPADSIVIFSAHGVAESVENEAYERNLKAINATCPLVTKVHLEAQSHEKKGRKLILIGHAGHPEVEGTSGRVQSEVTIISNIDDIENLTFSANEDLAYVTQTTLSVDDTRKIIARLKERFPNIHGPDLKDICYATQNRQNAVKELAKLVDLILVLGSSNSSNSNRLCDIAKEMGKKSFLINNYQNIQKDWFIGINSVGITAGASAPEALVQETIEFLQKNFVTKIENLEVIEEAVHFNLPLELRK